MTNSKKILFFDAKPYDQQFFDANNKDFGFQIRYFNDHLNPRTAPHLVLEGFDAVCAFVNDQINAEVIDILHEKKIGIVALRSAGYNNVDLKAAYDQIHVVRVPEYSPQAVAEHAVALMLGLNRKTHRAYYRTRDGNFSINGLLGFDMYRKIVGVVGTGRIGRALIPILKGFGMEILAYDVYANEDYAREAGFRYVGLDELYAKSDIISLHAPLTSETFHMIDENAIAKMKDGVVIINTSRGGLIKTEALIEALKNKKVGCAGLDVYEEESEYFFEDFSSTVISDDHLARLLTFPNVLLTSHQGFFTREALTNIARTTLRNLTEYFNGQQMVNEICYRCGKDAGQCLRKKGQRCFK